MREPAAAAADVTRLPAFVAVPSVASNVGSVLGGPTPTVVTVPPPRTLELPDFAGGCGGEKATTRCAFTPAVVFA